MPVQFHEQFANAMALLKADPQSKQAVGEVCSGYWSWVTGSLSDIIHGSGDITPFIEENADILDYGIVDGLVNADEKRAALVDCDVAASRIEVRTFTVWLKDLYNRVKAGDKVEKLQRDHKIETLKHGKILREIKDIQNERRAMIEGTYKNPADIAKQLTQLEGTEEMQLENVRKKKEISKGAFLSVEQKREHVKKQQELEKRMQFGASFISTQNKDIVPELKNMGKNIADLFVKLVDVESVMKKISEDLEIVQKKSSTMTPAEIETRLSDEIDYIRDLVRLSAKRLGLDPFPLIRDGDKVFSLSTLTKSLNQITEFDPLIFKNDRVPIFGRPYILLVPSTGNAIYDWKNNCIIMPTLAPGGNFMASLAAGIIEYRLDVDEDKALLTSFNKLPDLKTMRSIIALKARLTKEYIIWMTSEYNGYRILSKDSKKWFEHEIGPSRNDIFTPLELQSYTMTSSEFNELFDGIVERIKEAEEKEEAVNPDDLWAGSLLYYQMGKPEKALPLMEKYMEARPEHLMGWYNLGFMSMKQMNRTQAREAFNKYCKMDTQSWWSKLVRDHLRNLGPA